MKFILATKEKMTQVFDQNGMVQSVTVLQAGPVVITQIKDTDKDGYAAIQVGFGVKNEKNINKAQKGQFKDLGNFRFLKEFIVKNTEGYTVGDEIDISVFEEGDKVNVSSISKGKGFQGVVKRHNFAGGFRTHGQKHQERKPGSIGATGPQRVFKGLKMAGRMGSDRVTTKNLKVIQIDKVSNQLLVKGAVAGRKGSLVEVILN
ncbi:50S ribosomal protein L3 [Patescibacteria group bacterium]|nr:50S ribosomal protein L3 [Patescibacteria group bacterium]